MGRALQAVLFDMDGVVTDTAGAHAAAWQRLFDAFLAARAPAPGEDLRPFDIEADYRAHVDGRPRYDGVANFLAARGIVLPWGSANDAVEAATVCGLGNRKDGYFRAWLAQHRARAYPGTLRLVDALHDAGIRCAVFSASRNAGNVLRSAQVLDRFDARVDGADMARLGLPGKPDPAMLREAASRLKARPGHCAVVEDAIAGVQAAHSGRFGCVIGIDRGDRCDHGDALRQAGAHLVVRDLAEVTLTSTDGPAHLAVKTLDGLPSAWERMDAIRQRLAGRRPVVFLDYDGTLTPIVEDHTQAHLADGMRAAVRALGEQCTVAIVSGRDLAMLQRLVQLDSVFYAGSHGFEIAGPAGRRESLEKGLESLPELDAAEQALRTRLVGIPGHAVERKRFSIAVHFRRVAPADLAALDAAVAAVLAAHPGLRRGYGKKVFELQPRIDWDKGRAVQWLLERIDAGRTDAVPLYVGDDITDEHAFRALAGRGLCIAVRDGSARPTAADLALDNVGDVKRLLDMLGAIARQGTGGVGATGAPGATR